MLNGINTFLQNEVGQNSAVSSLMTNPINNPYQNMDRSLLIDESAISNQAVSLYQRDLDVRSFTKLAMSNPENTSADNIVEGLFDKGISDPYSDNAVTELVSNTRFLEDLGL